MMVMWSRYGSSGLRLLGLRSNARARLRRRPQVLLDAERGAARPSRGPSRWPPAAPSSAAAPDWPAAMTAGVIASSSGKRQGDTQPLQHRSAREGFAGEDHRRLLSVRLRSRGLEASGSSGSSRFCSRGSRGSAFCLAAFCLYFCCCCARSSSRGAASTGPASLIRNVGCVTMPTTNAENLLSFSSALLTIDAHGGHVLVFEAPAERVGHQVLGEVAEHHVLVLQQRVAEADAGRPSSCRRRGCRRRPPALRCPWCARRR